MEDHFEPRIMILKGDLYTSMVLAGIYNSFYARSITFNKTCVPKKICNLGISWTGRIGIRKYLFEISPLESYVKDPYAADGDSMLPTINALPGNIFYDKEKSGEWSSIPIAIKKARFLLLFLLIFKTIYWV